MNYILSEYISSALRLAKYEKLEDSTFAGTIPACRGVIAFAATAEDREREVHCVLEEWLLLGLRLGHRLPVVAGIDLNLDARHAKVESV
jgi:hypothetical protein